MGLFNTLMSKIFSHPAASAQTATSAPAASSPGQSATGASPGAQAPTSMPSTSATTGAGAQPVSAGAAAPAKQVDVAAVLNAMAAKNPEKLDWKHSIVDLMKLVGMDSRALGAQRVGHRSSLQRRSKRFRFHEHLAAQRGVEKALRKRREGSAGVTQEVGRGGQRWRRPALGP